MRRAFGAAVALVLLFTSGCREKPLLNGESIRALIESSAAFNGPIDPGIVFVDSSFHPDASMKRKIVSIEGVVVKDDGPFGLAGQTATVVFTWRWNQGPYADRVLRSTAKLNCSGGPWRVYNDLLKERLWASERGEE